MPAAKDEYSFSLKEIHGIIERTANILTQEGTIFTDNANIWTAALKAEIGEQLMIKVRQQVEEMSRRTQLVLNKEQNKLVVIPPGIFCAVHLQTGDSVPAVTISLGMAVCLSCSKLASNKMINSAIHAVLRMWD